MKNLSILVVLLYWYPYSGPHTPIFAGIFRELKRRGHHITIISSFPHFRSGSKETWDQFQGKFYEVTSWEDIELIRTYVLAPTFSNQRYGLISRALNFMSFSFSSLLAGLLLRRRPDIVLTLSSPPLINGLVGWILSKCKGAQSVHNILDIYPDMAEKVGIWKDYPVMSVLKWVEKLVYRLNPKLVVLSENMADNLRKKAVEPGKIAVIPDFVETEGFLNVPRDNAFSRRYGLNDHFVLMYAGNVGVPHGVEILVDVAEMLKEEADFRVCIVGRGEYMDRIVAMVKDRGLLNVVFPPRQPEHMVPLIWTSADASVVTYKPGLAEFSVPSKLLYIMASGRPGIVSADLDSDASRIVSHARCGISVPPSDATALVDAVLYLKTNRAVCREMGRRGQEYVRQHFEKMAVTDRFEELFLELSGSKRNDPIAGTLHPTSTGTP